MMRCRFLFLLLMLFAALATSCDSSPADSQVEAVQQRLVGTWLRDYEEQGTHVRRILILDADGSFREISAMSGSNEAPARTSSGSGEWTFDGTNLKRRYLRVNGNPASHPTINYATFELHFRSKSEFIGVDHVHQREVRYQRVPEGTLP